MEFIILALVFLLLGATYLILKGKKELEAVNTQLDHYCITESKQNKEIYEQKCKIIEKRDEATRLKVKLKEQDKYVEELRETIFKEAHTHESTVNEKDAKIRNLNSTILEQDDLAKDVEVAKSNLENTRKEMLQQRIEFNAAKTCIRKMDVKSKEDLATIQRIYTAVVEFKMLFKSQYSFLQGIDLPNNAAITIKKVTKRNYTHYPKAMVGETIVVNGKGEMIDLEMPKLYETVNNLEVY